MISSCWLPNPCIDPIHNTTSEKIISGDIKCIITREWSGPRQSDCVRMEREEAGNSKRLLMSRWVSGGVLMCKVAYKLITAFGSTCSLEWSEHDGHNVCISWLSPWQTRRLNVWISFFSSHSALRPTKGHPHRDWFGLTCIHLFSQLCYLFDCRPVAMLNAARPYIQ